MKKTLLFSFITLIAVKGSFSQSFPIEANFNSSNGWMPDQIGNTSAPLNSPGPSYDPYAFTTNPSGIIYDIAANTTFIDDASTQIARFGGATHDINFYDTVQAQKFISFCQSKNIEPLFQIPFLYFYHNQVEPEDAITTANIAQIKNMVIFLKSKGVKYYSISNESDRYNTAPFYKNDSIQLSAVKIAKFFKPIAVAIKEVQPTAIIFGPDLSQPFTNTSGLMEGLIDKNGLLGAGNITGKIHNDPAYTTFPDTNAYFCDIYSFHTYPFGGVQTRAQVIGNPSGFFQQSLDKIRLRINSSSNNPNLKVAVTELNVDYKNPANNNDPVLGITGVGCNSFLAGQWLAECYGRAMNRKVVSSGATGAPVNAMMPWAWHQSSGSADTTDLGILDNTAVGSDYSQIKGRSTYWHMWMLRKFTSTYYPGTGGAGTVSPAPPVALKTFANVEPAGFRILIINQNDSSYNFRVNFNNSNTTSTSNQAVLNFNINSSSLPLTTMFYNSTQKIAGRSTILLTFNCHGDSLESRYDYSEADNLAASDPHLRAVGNINLTPSIISCGKPMNIPTHISTNTTFTNDTIIVNSNVLITGSSELTFMNCLIVMAPGTKIKANPNAGIVMKNSVMIGCNGNTAYKGLELNGNHTGGRLLVENSWILGATNAIVADKISDMTIKGSVFGNGVEAISLNRSRGYTITNNVIAGYNTAIKTSNTIKDYVSLIQGNRLIEVETGIKMLNDAATKLDIICNSLKFNQYGIKTTNTQLKEQGTASVSAGNLFIKSSATLPADYLDHSGTATKYYYGPSDLGFAFPFVMNVPKILAVSDRVCAQLLPSSACPNWIEPDGIEEQTTASPSQMLVYPNPSQGDFTVSFKDLPKGNWNLMVFDMLGKLITSQKIDSNMEQTSLRINSKGLYFVSLQSENNRIAQKVIVE